MRENSLEMRSTEHGPPCFQGIKTYAVVSCGASHQQVVVIDVFLTYGSFICKVYGAVSSGGCGRKSREIVTRGQECGIHRETRCIMLAVSELGKEAPLGPPQAGGYCVH